MTDTQNPAVKTVVQLAVTDHRRDIVGMEYIYPVVSRRAGGVSVGINLNPNNACNWRCLYCQVPDLVRGNAPDLDLQRMSDELDGMLESIVYGDFLQTSTPPEARRFNDIALSGNGEPTSSRQFIEVVTLVGNKIRQFGLSGKIRFVLITNGSQFYKPAVQRAVAAMQPLGGEVWFKFDRAPIDGFSVVNQITISREQVIRHLKFAATSCDTWVQTCMFAQNGKLPDEVELVAYLGVLQEVLLSGAPLKGVLLYGIARPSMQPEAPQLSPAPVYWMQALSDRISGLGLPVKLTP